MQSTERSHVRHVQPKIISSKVIRRESHHIVDGSPYTPVQIKRKNQPVRKSSFSKPRYSKLISEENVIVNRDELEQQPKIIHRLSKRPDNTKAVPSLAMAKNLLSESNVNMLKSKKPVLTDRIQTNSQTHHRTDTTLRTVKSNNTLIRKSGQRTNKFCLDSWHSYKTFLGDIGKVLNESKIRQERMAEHSASIRRVKSNKSFIRKELFETGRSYNGFKVKVVSENTQPQQRRVSRIIK